MDDFNRDFILSLIARKFESLRVDYKRVLNLSGDKHKQELIKDVSAQANTLEIDDTLVAMKMSGTTGSIVIGADESGNLYDITALKLDDAKLQQIVNENIIPRIKFRFQPFDVKDALGTPTRIGAIIIERSPKPPHRLSKHYGRLRQGQCFVREGTSTREARDFDLERMYAHRLGLASGQVDTHTLKNHLEAICEDPEIAQWADPFYLKSESVFLPLYASPFESDTDTYQGKELIGLLREHKRMIVLGEGGIGKTTALERLALDYANWTTDDTEELLVPVFVRLLSYNGNLLRAVQASINQYGCLSLRNEQELIYFLGNTQCAVMLDGLNETPGRWRDTICADILEFMNAFPQHKLIVTSRPQDGLWHQIRSQQITAVVVQRLSLDDVRKYLVAHLGKAEGGRLFGAMSEPLRDLARLPLVLWLVRNVAFSDRDLLLTSRGELIGSFVQTILRRERGKGSRASTFPSSVKSHCLTALAYEMQEGRTLTVPIATVKDVFIKSLEQQRESFEWRQMFSEIKLNSLLTGEDEVRFLHQMFQDYFAALACGEQRKSLIWTELARDDWWHDTLILICSIIEEPSAMLQSIAAIDIVLAMKCLSEAKNVYLTGVFHLL